MSRLKHRVVVVTGATSGIGRATAVALARRGATVGLLGRRADALNDVAAACRREGTEALPLPADVADPDEVDAAARDVVGQFGRLDAWVNNAAVNLFARVEDAPVADWHRVVETGLFGTYHGVRAALPWLREQGEGTIVNVSSVLGKIGAPYQSAYVAAKHGIRGLSASIRQELEDVPRIHVCTVLPGAIDTPLFQQAGNYTGHRAQPLDPVILPERVARAVVRCIRKPKAEVVVGWSTRAALAGDRIAPRLTERVTARLVDRQHFAEERAAPGPGNVHAPDEEHTAVHGGWRNGQGRALRTGALVVAAGAAAVAAGRARR